MPVKRRKAKRSEVGGYEVWEAFLQFGYDMFRDLARAKLTEGLTPPPRDHVEEAWRRHGERLTVEHGEDTWANREFNQPKG